MCRPNNKISKAAAQAFIERRPFRKNWEWHYGDRVLESTNEVVEVEV